METTAQTQEAQELTAKAAWDSATNDQAESLCIICLDSARAVRLLPCNHCTTCATCTARLIGSSAERQCPCCRTQFQRVELHALDSEDQSSLERALTYESATGDGLSLKEFLLTTTIEPFVLHADGKIPVTLVQRMGAALEIDALCEGADEASLFSGTRDRYWTDLIDPDLCLTPPGSAELARWQAAEAETDASGVVRWASWVNHLDAARHRPLLADLAAILTLALPQLEDVSGHRLRGKRLQVVVGAFQHMIFSVDQSQQTFYRVSDWHIDGTPEERVVATATCYVEVSTSLVGGGVEFARQAEVWVDEPEATVTVQPTSGSLLVFNNALLRHRVHTISGSGRRRLIVFHLIDPGYRQEPSAATLPRQLCAQRRRESLTALAAAFTEVLHLRAVPPEVLELVWSFASTGATSEELQRRRDDSRRCRLMPRADSTGTLAPRTRRATGTGTLFVSEWQSGTGTSSDFEGDNGDDEFYSRIAAIDLVRLLI
eukprot:gene19204-22957_t